MTTPARSPIRCGKCGAEVVGKFCADCGSAANVKRDLSVKHFLREAAAAITDVDSVLLASFRDLIARPGQLTVSYFAGDRHRYLAPFRVFLVCNLLYFLGTARLNVNVLSTPLSAQLDGMMYKSIARNVVSHRLRLGGRAVTPAERTARDSVKHDFELRYNGATEGVAKTIVIVLIPLYALLLYGLYVGSTRYFAEHLVFSTHLVSFLIVSIVLASYAFNGVFLLLYYTVRYRPPTGDEMFSAVILAFFGLYTFAALRRVYGGSWFAAALRTGIIVAMVIPALVVFKFVLFFATLYWMS